MAVDPDTAAWIRIGGFVGTGAFVGLLVGGAEGAGVGAGVGLAAYAVVAGIVWLILRRGVW